MQPNEVGEMRAGSRFTQPILIANQAIRLA